MERKLANLFDRQRFERNAKLAGIVSDVENRYADALADDDLEMVSAAGTTEIPTDIPTEIVTPLLGRHNMPADEEKKTW